MVDKLNSRDGSLPGYTFQGTVESGGTSNPVEIPVLPSQKPVTVTCIPSSGSGRIEFSTSPDSAIEGGTANWQNWFKGNVVESTTDVLVSGVTGIRCVSVSGLCVFEIVV